MILIADVRLADGVNRYVATAFYVTMPSDSPPNVAMPGRLLESEYELAISAWWLGRDQPPQPISEVRLANDDGLFDGWPAIGVDDESYIRLWLVQPGAAYSTRTLWGSAALTDVMPSGKEMRAVAKGALSKLRRSITRTYPDTTPNAAIRGQPRPITLGHTEWVQPVQVDSAARDYELCDDAFEGIGDVYHLGHPSGFGLDYSPACDGIRLSNNPTGKLVCEVFGQVRIVGVAIDDLFPAADGSDNPAGWTTTEDGVVNYVDWVSPGQVLGFATSGVASIAKSAACTTGLLYAVEVSVTSAIGGSLTVRNGATDLAVITAGAVGLHRRTFTASAADISLSWQRTTTDADIRIGHVKLFAVERTDKIGGMLRWVMDRCNVVDWEDADLTALQATADYEMGVHIQGQTNGEDVFWPALDSIGASAFEDRNGVVRFVRVAPGTPGGRTFSRRNIDGGIFPERDLASGLSQAIECARNYAVHSDADMVSGATGPLEYLRRDAVTQRSGEVLRFSYKQAGGRDPLQSYLRSVSDALAEINRVNAFYSGSVDPFIVRFTVVSSDIADLLINPGEMHVLQYPRHGYTTPKDIFILYVRGNPQRSRLQVVALVFPPELIP